MVVPLVITPSRSCDGSGTQGCSCQLVDLDFTFKRHDRLIGQTHTLAACSGPPAKSNSDQGLWHATLNVVSQRCAAKQDYQRRWPIYASRTLAVPTDVSLRWPSHSTAK